MLDGRDRIGKYFVPEPEARAVSIDAFALDWSLSMSCMDIAVPARVRELNRVAPSLHAFLARLQHRDATLGLPGFTLPSVLHVNGFACFVRFLYRPETGARELRMMPVRSVGASYSCRVSFPCAKLFAVESLSDN